MTRVKNLSFPVMRTFKIYSLKKATFKYAVNYSHHAVHDIPMTFILELQFYTFDSVYYFAPYPHLSSSTLNLPIKWSRYSRKPVSSVVRKTA